MQLIIFSAANGFMFLKCMLISNEIPLEESMLALTLLLGYDGVSVLVDRWKKLCSCPAADTQEDYFHFVICATLKP